MAMKLSGSMAIVIILGALAMMFYGLYVALVEWGNYLAAPELWLDPTWVFYVLANWLLIGLGTLIIVVVLVKKSKQR